MRSFGGISIKVDCVKAAAKSLSWQKGCAGTELTHVHIAAQRTAGTTFVDVTILLNSRSFGPKLLALSYRQFDGINLTANWIQTKLPSKCQFGILYYSLVEMVC